VRILPADQGIREAIEVIHSGGIVAHATETCYGFACDLTNPIACKHLYQLKDRPDYLPVSALFLSIEATEEWVIWNEQAMKLAQQNFPGPLTIILPLQRDVLPHLPERTLGIRISSFPLAMMLAQESGTPLSTTSANVHGAQNPYSAEEILEQFRDRKHQPDLILDSGTLPRVEASTVVSVMNGTMQIVRQGSIEIPIP